ncbi:hypothetical protein A3D00_04790 [Candidatus Woesebacteria bacterium RIFCSPHIGHO2_02_FULL_38_9]|uniref:Transcriptional regulator MraZ n=1 Tax=Candidatus Woesebacteria bacterium RIFCSPHIGHO2_01_FULL_39_28 TaxID=1802496 RepID=A0A1F7YEG9_9BACT|nr:MAG: hypothetical protein A2627_02970 [Candidatus Woesebacteria bacterium RIFCSPHIGHO2_01_FULL_39_28]OGM34423.1 MAG: hypothetical protein A3D00_04790 [Candidatus Woesebacteria bacterium RIFCSPHIGHO2_02_FULL_38_9]OGM58009.1 MAG: hypothetical protein A3A50_01980 [Candidatus Woesebacteria bacterium RIFCSPLOWO2_01_FULL_38_20]
MLIGQHSGKLTQKGRLALPKKVRSEIGSKAIVARWYEGCFVVVSPDRWQALLEKLTARSEFITEPVRDTDRFILGSAYEVELDDQGRFVVPGMLRQYAGLKNEVIFLGLGDRVEVWDKETWLKRESLIQKRASIILEKVAKENGNTNKDS